MLEAEFAEEQHDAAQAEGTPTHARRKTADELGRASLTADPEMTAAYAKIYEDSSGDLDAIAAAMGGEAAWLTAAKKDPPADGTDWATCMLLGAYE
jgi:hypothetical protein